MFCTVVDTLHHPVESLARLMTVHNPRAVGEPDKQKSAPWLPVKWRPLHDQNTSQLSAVTV